MEKKHLEHNGIKFYATAYEDYYISTDGEVLSTKGKAPRVLKPGDNGSGYLFVVVCCDGLRKTIKIHRLMAETFALPGSGDTVDHIDRNKLNNSLSNLRLATTSEQLTNRVYPEHRSKRLTQDEHRELFEKYCNTGCSQIELTKWANERYNRTSSNIAYSHILNGRSCPKYYQQLPPVLKDQAQRLSDSRNPRLRGDSAHD